MTCRSLTIVVIAATITLADPLLVFPAVSQPSATTTQRAVPSLDAAYRDFHKGLSATTKEEKLKPIDAFLPTRKDIETLFPKDVEKIWALIEPNNRRIRDNVDQFAAEFTRGGAVKEIRVTDVRKTPDLANGRFKDLLALISNEIPLANLAVVRDSATSGSSGYVYVNNHWTQIRGIEEIPALLVAK